MIHYSCDRCKRTIDSEQEIRYIVRVEIEAAMDNLEFDDVEEDRDHLLEIEEIIERAEDLENEAIGEDVYQRRKYDLCSCCFREYQKNPLSVEQKVQLGFSKN